MTRCKQNNENLKQVFNKPSLGWLEKVALAQFTKLTALVLGSLNVSDFIQPSFREHALISMKKMKRLLMTTR